jgi:hypothetical protein
VKDTLIFDNNVITVLGNGPETHEPLSGDLIVRFNCLSGSEYSNHNLTLVINNGSHRFNKPKSFFSVGKYASYELNEQLCSLASSLELKLGCWPSSGFTFVWYLMFKKALFNIRQMPLLPSIARLETLNAREPLASTFHNWLGERRHAFKAAELPNWKSLFISVPLSGNAISCNPFDVLLDAAMKTKKDSSRRDLKMLAGIDKDYWLHYASPALLIEAEHLFYLDRVNQTTGNWWLFDFEGSIYANTIFQKLAWCQQSIFV